jgi:hypothetical protein
VLSHHLWWQLLLGRRVLPGCRPWHVGYGGQRRAHHLRRQQRVAVGAKLTAVPVAASSVRSAGPGRSGAYVWTAIRSDDLLAPSPGGPI